MHKAHKVQVVLQVATSRLPVCPLVGECESGMPPSGTPPGAKPFHEGRTERPPELGGLCPRRGGPPRPSHQGAYCAVAHHLDPLYFINYFLISSRRATILGISSTFFTWDFAQGKGPLRGRLDEPGDRKGGLLSAASGRALPPPWRTTQTHPPGGIRASGLSPGPHVVSYFGCGGAALCI